MKKNHLDLQIFQQLCSIASAYLDKMYVHFLELPFLKCNKNAFFYLKMSMIKKRAPFYLKGYIFRYDLKLPLFSK